MARIRTLASGHRIARLFVLALLAVVIVAASSFALGVSNRPADSGLLARARLGKWHSAGQADPRPGFDGYHESDFLYIDGKFYLFATGSQNPAWVDVYVGDTPEALVHEQPTFTHVAPIRYPTVVKDGDTWHMWGVNPQTKWTEHWVSTNADPTGFVYADSPFRGYSDEPVVDFAVRKNPGDGQWYGVGFENHLNAPLLLVRAPSPEGLWVKLDYVEGRLKQGIFGDTGAPSWATKARPDPNLAFTADGRAWVFFTGNSTTPPSYEAGAVEVDAATGKAIGSPVVLFDPHTDKGLPFILVSDLNLVTVPGQVDRIFGYTNSLTDPLAELDVPPDEPAAGGRAPANLTGFDLAAGFGWRSISAP